ncbi:MAG: methylenetetrahydrofolate reductase [NAD(P)H] [Pseudomonadota bacterium]
MEGHKKRVDVSFEFFPPNTPTLKEKMDHAIDLLAPLDPQFVSITYGADGSTRHRTHQTVARLLETTDLQVAPHLTCVDASQGEIDDIARQYWDLGARHLVALRGDPPREPRLAGKNVAQYRYAADLVAGLKRVADFEISVAAYPEVHADAPSARFDLDNLKRKIDAGASRAITQFFFDADTYLNFRDQAVASGITAPIVPGILPINHFAKMCQFANNCGSSVPDWLHERFAGLDNDKDTRQLIAAAVAIDLVETLQREGVNEFHFYTLNNAALTYAICHALGVRPQQEAAA